MKKAMATLTVVLAACALIAGLSTQAYAITGVCSNCHTMHNSQAGADLSGSPIARLLVGDGCLGCHKAGVGSNPAQNDGTGTPLVDHTAAPTFGTNTLAGGSFYWAQTDDTKGHNVTTQDANITAVEGAPGNANACASSCHTSIATATVAVAGCTGCHLDPSHHGNNSGNVTATPWYRWLAKCNEDINGVADSNHGVKGIEDDDWNFESSTDHNEYLGVAGDHDATQDLENNYNMSAFCSGCHGDFHDQNTVANGSGDWIRHPADRLIPTSGEYNTAFGSAGGGANGTWDPTVPVARPAAFNWAGATSSNIVNPGTDMVMCLSCHVAHGSPYADLLRWNYPTDFVSGGGGAGDGTGCFLCHTAKDS